LAPLEVCALGHGGRRGLFWRGADALDYLPTLVKLRILDALAGPEPETADQQSNSDRERIARAFPRLDGEEPGAPVFHRADHVRNDD